MAKTTIPDKSEETLTVTEGSPDLGQTPQLAHADRLADHEGKKLRMNGCSASAHAALFADVDVISTYPIRPYTAIMMNLAQFIADGLLDAEYLHADGEHSQLSIALGAGSSGARAFTGSSGVGITYAFELYSPTSGGRIPIQMAIADRTLDPPGDFGSEHTDALCTRDMGWLMGWACTPQEVFDKHLIGYAIGEDPRVLLPQMICQDGYFVSHISGDVQLPEVEQVERFLPPYKHPFALDPRNSVSHGPQIHPEQGPPLQLERARAMENAIPFMLEDAEVVWVIQGGHSVTCQAAVKRARERGIKAGMARLVWFRPFPTEDVQKALSKAKVVGVVETNLGLGGASYGGILSLDVSTALYHSKNRPLLTSFMAGLGGETVPLEEFAWMADKMVDAMEKGEVEKATHWVNFE